MKTYEFRDPVHGFIKLNEWEKCVIDHPCFQRLRRIKQLAWTDMVYPGATHTRFEHSIGVMHVASELFDSLYSKQKEVFSNLNYDGPGRPKQLVRLAALLHDIGHAPFSHAAEELFPVNTQTGRHHQHEEYSAAIVKNLMADVFEHPINKNNYHITVDEISRFFSPTAHDSAALSLRELVSGQMDADRMDYLLRDSYYAGVSYGNFDLSRVIATARFVQNQEDESYSLGFSEDGVHAAEGLLIARYMMFTQVYYHKTRVAYDLHLVEALRAILKQDGGFFPEPTPEGIRRYFEWDDWLVYSKLLSLDSEHKDALVNRRHVRLIHETPEVPSKEDTALFKENKRRLEENEIPYFERLASKNWYKFDSPGNEIMVLASSGTAEGKGVPLSERSSIVKGMAPVRQERIYVSTGLRSKATNALTSTGDKP